MRAIAQPLVARLGPACAVLGLLLGGSGAAAVSLHQLDDFQAPGLAGWQYAAPTNLTREEDLGNGYLQLVTDGDSTPGGRPVVTNDAQWAGDYLAAGITAIAARFANFGPDDLWIRLGFQSESGEQWVTDQAIHLPADGVWHDLHFGLDPADYTQVDLGPAGSFLAVLAAVDRIRFLSREDAPDWNGAFAEAVLGLDDVTAVPEPGTLLLVGLGLALTGAARARRPTAHRG